MNIIQNLPNSVEYFYEEVCDIWACKD